MPDCDREDLLSQQFAQTKQAVPEFAHEVYIFLREEEKPTVLTNYLRRQKAATGIQSTAYMSTTSLRIQEHDRDYAATRILELCCEKGYRKETHLLGVSILDRYLHSLLTKSMGSGLLITRDQMPLLVTTSTILAAKLEQPMTPSIKRMIKLLTNEEQGLVDKEAVIELEEHVLSTLQFDFNYPSALTFIERYLRLAELQNDTVLIQATDDLLKVAASKIVFLEYKPSLLAAAAFCLGIALTDVKRQSTSRRTEPLHQALKPSVSHYQHAKSCKSSAFQSALSFWDDQLEYMTDISSGDFTEVVLLLADAA